MEIRKNKINSVFINSVTFVFSFEFLITLIDSSFLLKLLIGSLYFLIKNLSQLYIFTSTPMPSL